MQAKLLMILAVSFGLSSIAAADQPPPPSSGADRRSAASLDRWADRLANEIDHLQEDLYYERGEYPRGLIRWAEQTSRAVAHFQEVVRRTSNEEHLVRDFQEMDRQVHDLVNRLNQSGDSWLSRQATRIRYADEQLHYLLRSDSDRGDRRGLREVLARHAHVLETEAKQLEQLVDRIRRRDGREAGIYDAIRDFADEAEHFHQVVERGADREHLLDDFQGVDEAWHRVVDQVNTSRYGLYLRRVAQRTNHVHNQIHGLLAQGGNRSRVHQAASDRPQIEFEIPGIGRFQLR